MYDHIGLKVKDLAASIRFYEAVLVPLGHVLGPHDDSYAGIGPPGAPALWLYAAKDTRSPGTHIAFRAWADATPADQRERLGIAATALCRKHSCEIVLVFDGDGSGRPALRRGGVRVLFSDAGEEADRSCGRSNSAPRNPRRLRRKRDRFALQEPPRLRTLHPVRPGGAGPVAHRA